MNNIVNVLKYDFISNYYNVQKNTILPEIAHNYNSIITVFDV